MSRSILNISSHRAWWQLFLLSVVSCFSVYVGLAFDEEFNSFIPEAVPLPSILNKKPSGLSALADIAERAGLHCQVWQDPYRNLNRIAGTVLIEEPLRSLSPGESKYLLDWVKSGNRLIYIDYFPLPSLPAPLFQILGLTCKSLTKANSHIYLDNESTNEFAHVKSLVISSNARIVGGNALVSDKKGALFTEMAYGRGHILLGLMSGFCANEQLQNKGNWDNFQFMINLFNTANGAIYFDERCHGYSRSNNVFIFLLRNTPGLVVSQLALILAIAVASSAQRFGAIQELKSTRTISNWQFIDGLANAYAQAGARGVALEIIVQDFKGKLCKILTLPTNATTTTIVSALQEGTPLRSGILADFLANYEQAVQDKQLSDSKLKQLVNKGDELRLEISEMFDRKNKR